MHLQYRAGLPALLSYSSISPFSRILWNPSFEKTKWSRTLIPNISPAFTKRIVDMMSASLGVRFDDGWLCATKIAEHLFLIASTKVSLG